MSYFTPLKPRPKLTLLYDCLAISFNENGRNKKTIINQHRVILHVNWVWFQFAHLNISFSLYSCHNNSCILTSITSWHWSWWKIWCLFYLNQNKITCWVWSLCPFFLQLTTYRYAYFTFSALWITPSAVWLWGPWFDKQANCHGNPASLALPEVLTEHFHSPLRSDMSKPRIMCPFHFRRLFPHYGWHL